MPDSNDIVAKALSQPRLGYQFVEDEQAFAVALAQIETCSELGIDAERASGFRYGNSAYLLQVGITDSANLIFDPVALGSIENWNHRLAAALNSRPWILHAATQDLPCLAELSIHPSELFDTELGARLSSIRRFGLASLAEELLGLKIAKEHSAADWSLRPLSKNMLNYAAIDVEVLSAIRDAIAARLEALGRTEWAAQEFRHLLSFRPRAQDANAWRRMSGAGALKSQRQQQIAASLWRQRDTMAKARDLAPGRLIPDSAIVAVAASEPASIGQLTRLRDFSGRESRSQIRAWWEAVERAAEIVLEANSAPEIPSHRIWERKFPDAWARYQVMRSALQPLVAELDIPPENLITPAIVREVAWQPGEVRQQLAALGARTWQIELVGELLSAALRSQE